MWKSSASHIPVLTLLPKLATIKRVLEIGAGELSTPLFLERGVYSVLECLDSVEDSHYWTTKITQQLGMDERLHLLSEIPGKEKWYDLIFIDGPQESERRIEIIKALTISPGAPVVVLHDSETGLLPAVDSSLAHHFTFNWITPHTSIVSNFPLDNVKLQHYHELMKLKFNDLEEDWAGWLKVFNF